MPRRPELRCADCGRTMVRVAKSRPEGQARCQPCRRARRETEYRERRRPATADAWPASAVVIRDCLGCGRAFVARHHTRTSCSVSCTRRARHRATYQPLAGQVLSRTCARCHADFDWHVSGSGRRPEQCDACIEVARRDASSRRRARLRGADTDQIDRVYVFDRDGWRCQLCGKTVPKSKAHPHPLSASLDHVVPLARGGDHVTSNVQLAHLRCNVQKGARGGGEQLALIG